MSETALELKWLDPADLEANERNWRGHPGAQRVALEQALNAVGWAGAALYNKTTARLIDGHLRKKVAEERGERIPVLVGEWTEEQERLILTTLDPIAGLAEANAEALDALLAEVRHDIAGGRLEFDAPTLDDLLSGYGADPPNVFSVPDPTPQQEPQLASEVLVEVYCSRADLDEFMPVLQEWRERDGVAVNIS